MNLQGEGGDEGGAVEYCAQGGITWCILQVWSDAEPFREARTVVEKGVPVVWKQHQRGRKSLCWAQPRVYERKPTM